MLFFIAGIMQGSHAGKNLHDQDYRERLSALVRAHFAGAQIYDPLANHRDSVDYDITTGRAVFAKHNRMCREVDVLIAYVPEASMGTAIEMWEAHEHGVGTVIAISPLTSNWAIQFSSHVIYENMAAFDAALQSGEVQRLIAERRALDCREDH